MEIKMSMQCQRAQHGSLPFTSFSPSLRAHAALLADPSPLDEYLNDLNVVLTRYILRDSSGEDEQDAGEGERKGRMGWLGLVLVVFTPVRYVTHIKNDTRVVITYYLGGFRSEGNGPTRGTSV
jgi:hypothetical protein